MTFVAEMSWAEVARTAPTAQAVDLGRRVSPGATAAEALWHHLSGSALARKRGHGLAVEFQRVDPDQPSLTYIELAHATGLSPRTSARSSWAKVGRWWAPLHGIRGGALSLVAQAADACAATFPAAIGDTWGVLSASCVVQKRELVARDWEGG